RCGQTNVAYPTLISSVPDVRIRARGAPPTRNASAPAWNLTGTSSYARMMPHPLIESRFKAGLFSLYGGFSAVTAASTPPFGAWFIRRSTLLFCFIDQKIFQNVLPVGWGERFFCRLCNESGGSEVRGPHAHEQTCGVMCIVGT